MKTIGFRSRVSLFLIAAVLLLQLSPGLAAGQRDAQQAAIQGSRFPGMPVPGTEIGKDKHHGPVEVTFTKWRTAQIPPPPAVTLRSLFAGFVEGDLGAGDFVAEILDRKEKTPCTAFDPPCTPGITPPTITPPIASLHAIYEVQVGKQSFTALIQGGTNGATGVGLLDGVILAGRRTGARVHVEFQTYAPPPTGPGCPDARAPADRNCFVGTIHIERAPKE